MFFVAVHVGAGYHRESKSMEYKEVMVNACDAAITVMRHAGGPEAACVAAIKVLEVCDRLTCKQPRKKVL
jgi:isoaspartyl peptidase/L-asparaginase-like protein (Ntn-hydrolase superfamily)